MLKNLFAALLVLSVVLMYTEAAAIDQATPIDQAAGVEVAEPSDRFFFFWSARNRCFATCVSLIIKNLVFKVIFYFLILF